MTNFFGRNGESDLKHPVHLDLHFFSDLKHPKIYFNQVPEDFGTVNFWL